MSTSETDDVEFVQGPISACIALVFGFSTGIGCLFMIALIVAMAL